MALSASEAIKTFYVKLIQEVPLDNTVFFAMAKSAGLFPLNTEDCVMAQETNAKKVTYLLRHVVERGPDQYLPLLLQVMKDSGVSNVVKLANDIEISMAGMYIQPCTYIIYLCSFVKQVEVCLYLDITFMQLVIIKMHVLKCVCVHVCVCIYVCP